MSLLRVFLVFFSFCLSLIVSIVSCMEIVTDGLDPKNEKGEKKNPYVTKFHEMADMRPTRCQVCRLLVTEFTEQMKQTDRKEHVPKGYELEDIENPDNQIDYGKSELRLMDVLENMCDRMKLYRARAGPEFPYIKGAKSQLREILDDLNKKSKAKLIYELPDEVVEDYTYEMTRLKFKCIHMLETHEDDITQWYFGDRGQDLLEWLCVERVLDEHEQDCLYASTEVPADFYSFMQDGDNHTEPVKPEVPIHDDRHWDL